MPTVSGLVRGSEGELLSGVRVRVYRRDTGALIGAGITGDGAESDDDWASVALLLHLDGEDGATTFLDSGPNGRSLRASGAARISSAQSVFGGSSLLCDASSSGVELIQSIPFSGTDEFTIEGWMYPLTTTTYSMLCGNAPSNVQLCRVQSSNGAIISALSGSDVLSATGVSRNEWGHFALVRKSGVLTMYYNGVALASKNSTTSFTLNYVGRGYNVSGHQFIDEFRVSNGLARYDGNFTPRNAPYPGPASLPLGFYTVDTGEFSGECYAIALDPDGGETLPDLLLRTTPV
ncbi:LamG-like jellyroll fold domain-containing protein [Thauera propionica]|uniref:LamG-like jellyroll fold domain-containing protein n=1 Tax=Thauera propionica TaxID=2019431 RepID=UPI0023F28FA6|nr:LamG-like jellyroll fold domain-containing protein [Thauera propionica]MDD3674977.1 hypothetical protein [Thauera propionica]